jgi:hypothetical protein
MGVWELEPANELPVIHTEQGKSKENGSVCKQDRPEVSLKLIPNIQK